MAYIERIKNKLISASSLGSGASLQPTHVRDRSDGSTILKTKEVALPFIQGKSEPVKAALTEEQALKMFKPLAFETENSIEQVADEIELQLEELQIAAPSEPSYLIQIQHVIAKMLSLQIMIRERDRVQKNEHRDLYKGSNEKWGSYQKQLGSRSFAFTFVSLAVLASQFLLPQMTGIEMTEIDKKIVEFLAKDGCNNVLTLFNAETQKRQKEVEGISTLAMAEINAAMNKSTSESSQTQELISLLNEIFRSLKVQMG